VAKYTKWIEAKPEEPVADVAARALRSRFEPVQDYLPLAAHRPHENVEFVHQARVWSRRAAAALRVYRDLLPPKRVPWVRKKLRRIRRATNDARDADVFLARLARDAANPGAEQLLAKVRHLRQEAQAAVVAVDQRLTGDGRFLRRCEKLLRRVRWRGAAAQQDDPPQFGIWAPQQIAPVADEFFEAAGADLSCVQALHAFRIAGKKLRYAMELLGAAFAAEFRTAAYPVIQEIQTRLGVINDHATAVRSLTRWAEQSSEVAEGEYLRGVIAAEGRQLEQLRGEFFAWWTPRRRNELHQLFQRLLAPHPDAVARPAPR
jgi:CHAD domain-containing protein